MQLHFRKILPNEVEKEVTQRDQFNSDEVELIEALVREAHQNSLDARPRGNASAVRTRIAFHVPSDEQLKLLAPILGTLPAHLAAAQVDVSEVDFGTPRFLVIEDFETTGLVGAWDRRDDKPFSDFWRRVGKSHKGGTAGGRWGLGKLVFSSASQGRAFFGLTLRAGDASGDALLMGQAVLALHPDPMSGDELDGVGFFCEQAENGLQLPIRDRGFIERFSEAVGMSRRQEPGLSIAIPYVRQDINSEGLIRSLLRNYYFPIVTGQLVSEVAGTLVSGETFDSLAKTHGGDRLNDGRVVSFVRELRKQLQEGTPDLTLTGTLAKGWSGAITEADLERIRMLYASGALLHVRVSVVLKSRKQGQLASSIDLFLRTTEGEGQGLVVRGGITLPGEGTEFRSRKCFGALIAEHEVIAEFLGDAENPAHTKWNKNAEKLNANWVNGSTRLGEIRGALNGLYGAVAQSLETVERDAFLDVLSVPGPAGGAKKKRHVPDPPPVPPIPRKPSAFDIRPRRGGFTVAATKLVQPDQLPIRIRLEAAYDVASGDPFSRHSDVDFDFAEKELDFDERGLARKVEAANVMLLEATEAGFSMSVTGFDSNRDLVIRGRQVR